MKAFINATDTFKELAGIYLAFVGVAAVVFSFAEDKPLLDSLWWAFVTAMTVGYGDFAPVTLIGRINGVVLMHVAPLIIIPLVVARLLDKVMVDHDAFTHTEQEALKLEVAAMRRDLADLKVALLAKAGER